MGQLIKLQDYISRYEIDTYRYPGQFIRLKKQHWEKVKNAWVEGEITPPEKSVIQEDPQQIEGKNSLFQFFKRKRKSDEEVEDNQGNNTKINQELNDEIDFSFVYENQPKTIEELKQVFLNHIFDFQMKWASSTVREKSYVDREFFYDSTLKYFLQRFPDTYLLLYQPIFLLKKAPVEVEIILLSPTTTWCITILESKDNSVFVGSKERFWIERNGDKEKKLLSPLIGLQRMDRIVRKIYSLYEIDLPIRKVILNRSGYFDYPSVPFDIELVDKRNYEAWFTGVRNMVSPLKHMQLKAANALLQYCQTTYVRRMD